ncbi:enterotoxin [uncultured Clostridium sp.]|jgi:hypothetical protein|uniref:enterotoxin n=1 Tax=uncultured Clostridium sp. TaxID=59620 RepID=UPI002623028B|nr:enterotoxin [uncultured Clostridium sp.]
MNQNLDINLQNIFQDAKEIKFFTDMKSPKANDFGMDLALENTEVRDGVYTVKRGSFWIRGGEKEDIITTLYIPTSTGIDYVKEKTIGAGSTFGITITGGFNYGFIKANISTAFNINITKRETIRTTIRDMAVDNKDIHLRVFVTHERYDVINVKNNKIIDIASVYYPVGTYVKRLIVESNTKIKLEQLEEYSYRSLGEELEIVEALVNSLNVEEPSTLTVIGELYEHETQTYELGKNINCKFVVSENKIYEVTVANAGHSFDIYEIQADGSIIKTMVECKVNKDYSTKALVFFGEGKKYLIVIKNIKAIKEKIIFREKVANYIIFANATIIDGLNLNEQFSENIRLKKYEKRIWILENQSIEKIFEVKSSNFLNLDIVEFDLVNNDVISTAKTLINSRAKTFVLQANKKYFLVFKGVGEFLDSVDISVTSEQRGKEVWGK